MNDLVYTIEFIDDLEGYDRFLGVAPTLDQAKERALEEDGPSYYRIHIQITEWNVAENRGRVVANWMRVKNEGPGKWQDVDTRT